MIVDLFAGGGGASLGIRLALGRDPDIAVNHDPEAVALHRANHPNTQHLCGDVWDVRPRDVVNGRPVELLWASPDCTYHSKARGGKPFRDPESAEGRRGLAWVVTRWAHDVRPRVICLENVEEFADWGPLGADGRRDPARKGLTFRRFVGTLKSAGYVVEWRELRASDYGTPTIRKRLFLIARCDGLPIVWPAATHGRGLRPQRSAAECIDWSLSCPSIFERRRPLAEKTLARIARGIRRYVLEAGEPFLVAVTHRDHRVYPIGEPLRTVTGAHRGELALVSPTLVHSGNGERRGQAPRVYDIERPLTTVMAQGQKHGLVAAFLAKHYGGGPTKATGSALDEPVHTVTCQGQLSLIASTMVQLKGTSKEGRDLREPTPAICASGTHLAEVRAFLTQYNGESVGQQVQLPLGTVTTKDRFGIVTVHGEDWQIVDIGFRMLQPRELYRAQGFPDSYDIDVRIDQETADRLNEIARRLTAIDGVRRVPSKAGDPLTAEAKVRMCGNSVCPPLAAAIVRANVVAADEEIAAE